jgi:two-component system chemotaxis response regulator CheY
MNALVVDDSAVMRHTQKKALLALGWTVEVASDGQHALSVIDGMPSCELVLTDWHMPGMDGLALVRALRSQPSRTELRILMVTSESLLGAVESALEAGADDFLMKPYEVDALSDRIADVMNARR